MRIVDSIEGLFQTFANIVLFFMMFVITLDGIFRYIVNSPIVGVHELVEYYLIVAIVFFGISSTFKLNRHISIDIVVKRFSEKNYKITKIFTNFFIYLFCLIVFYQNIILTYNAWINNDIQFGIISWPMFLAYGIVPIGIFILVLRLTITIYQDLIFIRKEKNLHQK